MQPTFDIDSIADPAILTFCEFPYLVMDVNESVSGITRMNNLTLLASSDRITHHTCATLPPLVLLSMFFLLIMIHGFR